MTTNRIASTIEVVDQDRLIKELGSIQQALATPKLLDPFPYLRTGRKCVVTAGPLKGVEGFLVRRKNINRLVLQVDVLGHHGVVDGEGIGLTIVRRIIDRHNGSINVESEVDKGTKFTVTLPAPN